MQKKDNFDLILLISDITLNSVYEHLPKNMDTAEKKRIALSASLRVKTELLNDKDTLESIYIERHQWIKMRNRLLINLMVPIFIIWFMLVVTFYVILPEKLNTLFQALEGFPFWIIIIILNILFLLSIYNKVVKLIKDSL